MKRWLQRKTDHEWWLFCNKYRWIPEGRTSISYNVKRLVSWYQYRFYMAMEYLLYNRKEKTPHTPEKFPGIGNDLFYEIESACKHNTF